MQPARRAQLVLAIGFVGILAGVPVGQVGLELSRGRRVQFADLFRYAPSERNLRRFERTLEAEWWGSRTVRPWTRAALVRLFDDLGARGLAGRDGWVFYRPGVRYLVEAGAAAPEGRRAGAGASRGRREAAVAAIVRFGDQLRGRGLRLLVVPVPGKASVYPDRLTRRAAGRHAALRSPTEDVLAELGQCGVETVDLFALFRARREQADGGGELYLATDTHWTPAGAAVAAEAVARKLRQLGWAPEPKRTYRTRRVRVARRGDILEMLRAGGLAKPPPEQVVACEQVLDEAAGLMVPDGSGPAGAYANHHLKDTPLESTVLVLGDSFCRIYQTREPRSLGRVVAGAGAGPVSRAGRRSGTKRLLPGSAGFCSLVARALGAPVDYIVSDGGAATDVRRRLCTNPAILDNKKVVVWQFAERELHLGADGWQDVPLPPSAASAGAGAR